MNDRVGEGQGIDWNAAAGTPQTPPASPQAPATQSTDTPMPPAQTSQDRSNVRGFQRDSAQGEANRFEGTSSFTNWQADSGQAGPERGQAPSRVMPPISDGPAPGKGSGGLNAQTLAYPSDDGGTLPTTPPAAETLAYPSDDGGTVPSTPPAAETLVYPSDDGGTAPSTPSAPEPLPYPTLSGGDTEGVIAERKRRLVPPT